MDANVPYLIGRVVEVVCRTIGDDIATYKVAVVDLQTDDAMYLEYRVAEWDRRGNFKIQKKYDRVKYVDLKSLRVRSEV